MNLSNEDLTNKFAEASHKGLLSTESFKLEQEILSCLASGEKAIQAMEEIKQLAYLPTVFKSMKSIQDILKDYEV